MSKEFITKLTNLDSKLLELIELRNQLVEQVVDNNEITSPDQLLTLAFNNLAFSSSAHSQKYSQINSIFNLLNKQFIEHYNHAVTSQGVSQNVSISYLGLQGSYSYHAASEYANLYGLSTNELISCPDFVSVLNKVVDGVTDYAVLPVENTSSGSINEVYDLLIETDLRIEAELGLDIEHSILALNQIPLNQIEVIYSHPQPFYQCSKFLNKYCAQAKLEPCLSTSHAIEDYLSSPDNSKSTVIANGKYNSSNFKIIASSIANSKHNQTRFFVFSKSNNVKINDKLHYKTAIRFETLQEFGSLATILNIFKEYKVNLTKLESRPLLDQPWKEAFFVEVDGYKDQLNVAHALTQIDLQSKSLKILGCYPSFLIKPSI